MPKRTTTYTAKEQRFVDEYRVDYNAAQAALRAGYSTKSAKFIGNQLLKKPAIAAAIAQHQAQISEKTGITAELVLQELVKLGFSNMLDYMTVQADGLAYIDLTNMTRSQAAAIAEITIDEYMDGHGEEARLVKKIKLKLVDKRAALVNIGDQIGMFVKRSKSEITLRKNPFDDWSDDELQRHVDSLRHRDNKLASRRKLNTD